MSGRFGLTCGAALVAALLALPGAAQARTSVYVGVGPAFPVYPAYPYPHFHRHYYPGPVIVAPPPAVYYEPPPTVVYRRPPTVVVVPAPSPLAVDPAGPAYLSNSGQVCREYQTTVVIGGVQQPGYGTACQQPDGSWRVVN